MPYRVWQPRWIFFRLWRWLSPRWWAVVLMPLGDLLALGTMTVIPLVIAQAIDGPIMRGDYAGIWFYIDILLALTIAQTAFFSLRFLPIPAIIDAEMAIRRDLFAHVQRLSLLHHSRHGSGDLLSRLIGDVSQVSNFVHNLLPWTISTAVTLVITTVLLVAIHPILGSVVVLALVPLGFASNLFQKHFYKAAQAAREGAAAVATAAEESVVAVRILKSFGGSRFASQRFRAAAEHSRDAELTQIRFRAWFNSFMAGYPMAILALVVIGGGSAVAQGSLSVGTFVAFTAFYFRILTPVSQFGQLLFFYQISKNALVRISDLFDTPLQIAQPTRPKVLTSAEPLDLHFEQVHFFYEDLATETLKGVDLHIPVGETLALVGATGSGKSAIAALAARLMDPTAGRVCLGGVDLRELDLAYLRNSVGVAFEDGLLFSGSIHDNLVFGRSNIELSDIEQVLFVTQSDFVLSLPDGLSTILGERGLSLSGGQRQRLALARALLGKPRLLILDDPTSALDLSTESALNRALCEAFGHITTLVVARRPSTAMLADRVALLEDGRITAVGTHQELLASSAAYRRILVAARDRPGEETREANDRD